MAAIISFICGVGAMSSISETRGVRFSKITHGKTVPFQLCTLDLDLCERNVRAERSFWSLSPGRRCGECFCGREPGSTDLGL